MPKHETCVTLEGRFLAVAVLLGAGYLVGATSRETIAQADVRPGAAAQEPFRSGAQRSEIVLREISATLSKMDARMERMEKLAAQIVNQNGQQLPGEIR